MFELSLPNMTCGHCASTVTQTCKLVDPAAHVDVDLNARHVKIQSSEDRQDFVQALAQVGYPQAS